MPVKECVARKCDLKDTVIDTDYRYCASCGAKLQTLSHNDSRARKVIVQSAPVTPAKEDMVKRAHNTIWSKEANAWVCWCGWAIGHSGFELIAHERQVDEVPRSQSPVHQSSVIVIPTTKPAQTDDWECSPDISGCPLITKEMRPRIDIPYEMWEKWRKWARGIKTEWLAYLIGEPIARSAENPLGGWTLTDLWIPKQRVTSTHVSVDETCLRNLKPGTIGDVHSHVGMSVFFSAEDQKHFNHEVHLVINNKDEIDSSIRIKLDCHKTSRTAGRLMLIDGEDNAALEAEMTSQFVVDPSLPVANVVSEATAQSITSTSQYGGHSYSASAPNTRFGRVRGQAQDTWLAN